MEAAAPRAGNARWTDLRKRFLSAILIGPAALGFILLGGLPWTLLIILTALVLGWEWVRLCGQNSLALPGVLMPVAMLAAAVLAGVGAARMAVALLISAGLMVALLGATRWGGGQPSRLFALGITYIGVAVVALIDLRRDDMAGLANVLFLCWIVTACDIGAYLAGRAIGGRKLWPAISPNKTWSGALGGLAAGVAAGVVVAEIMAPGGSGRAMLLALLLGVASQAGDLLESVVKRRFGVKDSSGLIPGHGGLLDRLDGLLAAATVAALIALALGPGHPLWR